MLSIIQNRKESNKHLKRNILKYKKVSNFNNKKHLKMLQISNKKSKRNLVKVE